MTDCTSLDSGDQVSSLTAEIWLTVVIIKADITDYVQTVKIALIIDAVFNTGTVGLNSFNHTKKKKWSWYKHNAK